MIKLTTSATAAALVLAASSLAFAATDHTGATTRSRTSAASINKTQAMNEIKTDGYTNVQDLRKDKSGWTAAAMESGKPVSLRIDSLGNVRKQ
jgi:Peptidase propeptide and YPEB domain